MMIIMMVARAPPVCGFIARKGFAVAQGALSKARMGQGRAQQERKHYAEGEKKFTSGTHAISAIRGLFQAFHDAAQFLGHAGKILHGGGRLDHGTW